jgi:hypothetical protein
MNKRIIVLCLIFLGAILSTPAWPWDPTELPPGFTVEKPGPPVELEGKVLFVVRVNFKSVTAQERAQQVSELIKKLAEDPLKATCPLELFGGPQSSGIQHGKKIIDGLHDFGLFPVICLIVQDFNGPGLIGFTVFGELAGAVVIEAFHGIHGSLFSSHQGI